MKTKTVLLYLTTVLCLACVAFLSVANRQTSSSIDYFLSETQRRIQKLNEHPHESFLKEATPYLRLLGLVDNPIQGTLSDSQVTNLIPTLAIPALSGSYSDVVELILSAQHFLPNYPIQVFDVTLGQRKREKLQQTLCNSSVCQVFELDLKRYPSHLKYTQYEAYRPMIIREVLNSSGAVFYVSPKHRFVSTAGLAGAVTLARQQGIATWPLQDPTSALTHPRMFTFYQTQADKYYFHRASRGDRLILYNTPAISSRLMLPWLQCAFTMECLSPLGAEGSSCYRERKPKFLFAGCHNYDLSAFNVVLGLMFDFEAQKYLVEKLPRLPGKQFEVQNVNQSFFVDDRRQAPLELLEAWSKRMPW